MYICICQGFPQSMLAQSMLHELTSLIICSIWLLDQILKFVKNPILIRISSDFLHNVSACICIGKFNKNGEFSPCHFLLNLDNDPVL